MILCPEDRQAQVREVIGRHAVHACAELTGA
jgi:hypothetical protein